MDLKLPPRYEPIAHLGKGGGGEVWSVRDRHSGSLFALKVLGEEASEPEMAALVREAVALSGLEGLGLPRVQRFGRLPSSGRPFMVRDLVDGRSLLDLMDEGADLDEVVAGLATAAAQLTELHRAGLFHGDIKPANIIVGPAGKVTLVDLGLAAPWQEFGSPPEGLTPKYAAPELFAGKPLTVRAEIFALGATLEEALEKSRPGTLSREQINELKSIGERATASDPDERQPSADEFAAAVRRAARIGGAAHSQEPGVLWPIVGIDGTAGRLLEAVHALGPGEVLRIDGPEGAGRSALLRRLAWSLGVEGRPLVWLDGAMAAAPEAVAAEFGAFDSIRGAVLLIDDASAFTASAAELVKAARSGGARLVVVGDERFGETQVFVVPPLEPRAATELMRRAVPSLTEHLLSRAYEMAGGRPGELRRLVRLIASSAVASTADIEHVLGTELPGRERVPLQPLERARYFLDRGRCNEAGAALEELTEDSLETVVERARLDLALGDAPAALKRLLAAEPDARRLTGSTGAKHWMLYLGRAHIGTAEYARAEELLAALAAEPDPIGAEALAFRGLACSYLGRHEEARQTLERAVALAREASATRVEAIGLLSLGVVLQRDDRIDEARQAYQQTIEVAERAAEAGLLSSAQLNLAGVLKMSGDLAGAIEHFEAAVDMGRRSGRRSTVRNALLNLANTDLYLGRLARARSSIEALEEQRAQLPAFVRAQLTGQQAELAARSGQTELAVQLYQSCAAAYEALNQRLDSAEARLEGLLVAARRARPDLQDLRHQLEVAQGELGDAPAHRPLLLLARARLDSVAGEITRARATLDAALAAARDARQREWVWRALEARADLAEAEGQSVTARRDREDALAVLEEIGARLPRDLREVYWNDPRRRSLRASVKEQLGRARTDNFPVASPLNNPTIQSTPDRPQRDSRVTSQSISELTRTPLEQRLARILEVNAELAGEHDLDRLTARVTGHAVDLLRAERGIVLLVQPDGSMSVHTSRTRSGEPNEEFSRSIAKQVIAKGEPIVSLSARDDARMSGYASVHQLMVHSVACVPIMAPGGKAIGALYLETRHAPGVQFERELPTLRAFADQVAIAIETARLVSENLQRADDLSRTNAKLEEAQARLRELLGDRTAQLKRARQQLRETRETLYGHFGYHGLVGTSVAMRRVYALIDRVKDTDVPVLITGESGTGKEMVARAIHASSHRSKNRFLGVNCGAIPDNLLESELFGHVRGAFTGADRERKGLFRDCEGGSVLLDEIGEMPTKMQAGMLRVLQERKVRPVGGTHEEAVDVRLIFATHRDLMAMVREGRFREDLYYRIHVVAVDIPPLRERAEDIPQLVDHFLGRFAARYKRERKAISREAMRRLMASDWPGNVRQLEHVLLNAWVLSDRPELEPDDLALPGGLSSGSSVPPAVLVRVPSAETEGQAQPQPAPEPSPRDSTRSTSVRKRAISQHRSDERSRILDALRQCNWNRVKAAELIGIPRRTFYRRLREYGIQ